MPTFSRALAALLIAGLFWLASEWIKPLLPEATDPGRISEINAAIAGVVGWRVSRGRVGGGWVSAPALGLTLSLCALVAVLALQTFVQVMHFALDRRYDGATEALVDVVQKMMDYTMMLSSAQTWGLILGGGILIGYLAEFTHRTLD